MMNSASSSIPRLSVLPLSLAGCVLATGIAQAGPYGGGSTSSVAEREVQRRMHRVNDAQAAIEQGDNFYKKGDYEGARSKYKEALDLIPDAPFTEDLRAAARDRYCNASVKVARERANGGRYDDARRILKEVLDQCPEHKDALVLLKQLDDPERFNPALNPEHVKNVADVKRHLEMGHANFELGLLDEAVAEYENVLRIDPYNKAARHEMEKMEQEKSRYYDVARNHTRSKFLRMVDQAWEDSVPIAPSDNGILSTLGGGTDGSRYYLDKMTHLIFPQVQFQGASIDEAVEFLRIKSRELDVATTDPAKKGVNLIIRPGAATTASITLDLHQVPMIEALRYITELAGMKYKIEPYAVVVVPPTDTTTEQFTRTFRVPPNFLSLGSGGEGETAPAGAPDPFAARPGAGRGGAAAPVAAPAAPLATRPTAIDILKQAGIQFPDGSSASFVAATSQLIVHNTQPMLDQVEAFVESLQTKAPQQIYITSKFLEVSQENTDELGFDWLLGQFNLPGSGSIFGSGGTTGNSANGATSGSDYPFLYPGTTTPVGGTPVSGGLRSGSAAITPDSISGLIAASNNTSSSTSSTPTKAPGVFAISGVYTDPQFQVVIRALAQKKGTDLMSAPSVTTRSGQRASVEVVREFRYPTEFNPPQIPTTVGATGGGNGIVGGGTGTIPVTPTTPTAFEMRPVGVRMEVDPVLGPDGYTIDLNLSPEVVEFDGFVNYGSPIQTSATDALGNPTTITLTENKIVQPVFTTRKVTTAVTIWDGQTVAMGGLIQENVQDVEDKIPILGDLPIIGRLFQSKASDHLKTNLIIFVTAKLIDPSGSPVRPQLQRKVTPTLTTTTTVSSEGGPGVLTPIPAPIQPRSGS